MRAIPYDAELDYSEGGGEATLRLGAQRLNRASCWWDPAYGDPERGDGSVIACVFTDEDGNRRIHAIEYITFDPKRLDETDELTQQCEKAIAFADRNFLPRITVETNGIGRMVPGTLRRLARERGLAISVREQSNRTPKALRILDAFDAALAANRLYAHADVLASPLISEMRDWRPDTDGPDDGLDAVAGCLLEEPYPLPAVPAAGRPKPRRDWRRGIKPATARTDFAI